MLTAAVIGELLEGSTCLERAKVLRERGWEVVQFDTTPYLRGRSRLLAGLQHRLLWGPDVARFNRDVLRAARSAGRLDAIWVDKGRWLRASTLEELKHVTGALAIHFTPDPAFTLHNGRHLDACFSLYDLCVTTKRYELDGYRSKGAREVLFTWQGVDDRFERVGACRAPDERPVDVVFVRHLEPHYLKALEYARSVTGNVAVHDPGWERIGKRRPHWRGIVGAPVLGDALAATLARGRVGLGLLSKFYPDAFTTRSFEVPAAGAMLLAERTADHETLFQEDREAVFFGSAEELRDKLSFYLRHEAVRRGIAAAGQAFVLSTYHWRQVLAPVIERVEQMRRE